MSSGWERRCALTLSAFVPRVSLFFLQIFCAQHLSCPFGATAAVHGWERVGEALAYLARVLLFLPSLRHVDDYVGPDRWFGLVFPLFAFLSCT